MKLYTAGFLFNEDEREVLLIRKNHPEWQKGRLNGIGGHFEDGETPIECMIREFKEETGLFIHNWEEFAVISDEKEWKVHFFSAVTDNTTFNSHRTMTDEEVIPVMFSYPGEGFKLPNNVMDNLDWLIKMALSNDCGKPFNITERYNDV